MGGADPWSGEALARAGLIAGRRPFEGEEGRGRGKERLRGRGIEKETGVGSHSSGGEQYYLMRKGEERGQQGETSTVLRLRYTDMRRMCVYGVWELHPIDPYRSLWI